MRRESVKKLVSYLSDERVAKRRYAAEALSNADERALYPLIRALRDPNAGVQDAAMRSLIAIGGETTAYMVLPLLREDSLLRNTALIILKEIGAWVVPLLRPLLVDKDDDVRKFAIDLLMDINHCDYLDDLLTVLQEDGNANVRAAAAKALGIFAYAKAIPHLIQALGDDEWVAFSALEALSLMKIESTVEPIAALLSNSSPTLRYTAVETLGQMGFSSSGKYLLQHLPQAEGMEKTALLKSLIQVGQISCLPQAAEDLLDMFKNSDWEDRLIALQGLAELGQLDALPAVLDAVGSLDPANPDEMDIIYAVKERLRGLNCSGALIEILNNPDAKYKAKTIAIEIMEEQGCQAAIPHLIALFKGNWRDVKRASIQTLKEICGENSEEMFLGALDDDDGHVRKSAVCALGRIGDEAILDDLLKLLEYEPYQDVREEIVKAVLAIDPQRALHHLDGFDLAIKEMLGKFSEDLDILILLAQDADLKVRLAALGSLGVIDDERAYKTLIESLNNADAEIRKTALMALGEQGCGMETIVPLLADSDVWVRIYAVRALGQSCNPQAMEHLIPMLKVDDIPVVLSAMDALEQLVPYGSIDLANVLTPLLDHKVPAIQAKAKEMIGRLS